MTLRRFFLLLLITAGLALYIGHHITLSATRVIQDHYTVYEDGSWVNQVTNESGCYESWGLCAQG